jgi:uncharacterized membrane protein YwaF
MILTAPIFGSKHLIGLLVVTALIVLGFYLITKKEYKKRNVMIFIMIWFLVLEVIKLSYITINNGSFPLNHIPLHLCSLPLYLYPILALSKSEHVKKFVFPAAYATVLFGGVIALLYPVNIIGGLESWAFVQDNFLPFISFLYHGMMIFAALYLLKSEQYTITWRTLPYAYYVSLIFMIVAIIFNTILDKDFMLLNYGNGSPVQFIHDISPILYTLTMIGLGFFAIFVFHGVTLLFVRNRDEA